MPITDPLVEKFRNTVEDEQGLFDRRLERERYIRLLENRIEELADERDTLLRILSEQEEIDFLYREKYGR